MKVIRDDQLYSGVMETSIGVQVHINLKTPNEEQ